MKLEDGSEIQFLEKPYWRDDFWCAIKITKNDQVFGVAFDEESYLEFLLNFLNLNEKAVKLIHQIREKNGLAKTI